MIINFANTVGIAGFLSGIDLISIKNLVENFIKIKSIFLKIMLEDQFPEE